MGRIVWLASYPRSGNTWLRAFLHNLLRDPDLPYDINRLQDFTLIEAQARWFQALDPRPTETLTKEEVAALRPRVHQAMTRAFPDTVFVKTHNALVEDRGTPLISLEATAGAIYVVRNPLDVAVSYAAHFGVSLDEAVSALCEPDTQSIANTRHFVYELFGSWSQHVGSWTASPNPALHIVRYEDMQDAPRRAFGGIAAFLGLEPGAARLDKAIRHSGFRVLQEQERRRGFRERSLKADRFFRSGRSGEGRRALTQAQIDRLVEANGAEMRRFGYSPLTK